MTTDSHPPWLLDYMFPSPSACISSGLGGLSSELVDPWSPRPFQTMGVAVISLPSNLGKRILRGAPVDCLDAKNVPLCIISLWWSGSVIPNRMMMIFLYTASLANRCQYLGANHRFKIAESPLGTGEGPPHLVWSRRAWASLVVYTVRDLPAMQETWVWSLGQQGPLKKGMATYSNIPVWRIPWTEDSGRLQYMGLQSVDWVTNKGKAFVLNREE